MLGGRCDLSGPRLHLSGTDTRIVWRSDATSFVVLLDDTSDSTPDGTGYPAVACDGPCAASQFLVERSGEYVVRVQATDAPWQVLVQEYRVP